MNGSGAHAGSVETRTSWVVATVALIVLSVSYGAPLTTVVALKPIAARIRRDAFGAGAGGGADLHRRRLRRHRHGLAGRADRHPLRW